MKNQIKFFIALGFFLGGLGLHANVKAADEESLDKVHVTSTTDKAFGTTPLLANDCNSTGTGTNCSIRQALRVVKSGGSIIVPAGDYCLKSSLSYLEIDRKSVTLTGAGTETGSATVIGYAPYDTDGDGTADSSTYLTGCTELANSRVLKIEFSGALGSEQVKVEGVVIANGRQTGTTAGGGGVYIYSDADTSETVDITLTNMVITGNTATDSYGGGISVKSDVDDGGVSTINITDQVTVSGNTANQDGGGIYVDSYVYDAGVSTINITDQVTVSGNTAAEYGGGLFFSIDPDGASASINLADLYIHDNTALISGGGIDVYGYGESSGDKIEFVIKDSIIQNNRVTDSASRGAGLNLEFGSFGVSALFKFKLENSSILDNTSAGNGGGISSMIYSDSSDDSFFLEIVNSTISGNTATQNGGAIYLNDNDSDADSTLSLSLKHSNILNNTSDLYGGGIYSQYWNVTSFGSVIESNSGIGLANDCYISGDTGSFTSGGYNALRTTPSAEATCLLSFSDSSTLPVTSITTDITGDVDIGLAPLTIDSATGLSYYPLKEGSILQDAIPEGDCDSTVATDQVGTTRPQGSGCDIGSYEKLVTTGGGTSTSGSETSTSTTSDGGSSGEETTGTGSGGGEEGSSSGTSGGTGSTGETGTGSSGSESTAGSTTTGSSDTGGQGSENQGEGGGGCSFLITN